MSEEQLYNLFAGFKEVPGFCRKLKGAADLDTAVAMAKEAGFDVRKADWLKFQAKQTLEFSDEELERVAGGFDPLTTGRPVPGAPVFGPALVKWIIG